MPTQVYYNLNEDKQNRIKDAALSEFSKYPFEEASIKRIIEDARIARGSFYQYFEDLQDCFVYILTITRLKIQKDQLLSTEINPNDDFLLVLKEKLKYRLKKALIEDTSQKEYLLLKQIQNSSRGQDIFVSNLGLEPLFEIISKKFSTIESYKNIDNSNIKILFETLIAAIEKTIYKIIRKEIKVEEAFHEIDIKVDIIRFGIIERK